MQFAKKIFFKFLLYFLNMVLRNGGEKILKNTSIRETTILRKIYKKIN